jgi:uncharacterized membrane protein
MSDRALARAMLVLALVGVVIAGYLAWVHYAGIEPLCAGGGAGCERVQASRYAELGGVPVALLGIVGYLAIAGALVFAPAGAARPAVAFLALAGAGFSAYLTYLELFEIDAVCQWCVASAVVMGLLAVLAVTRLLRVEA